jgi:hypothetical protein
MAERVGFVPDDLAPINDLGLIESAQTTQIHSKPEYQETGTAILRCLRRRALVGPGPITPRGLGHAALTERGSHRLRQSAHVTAIAADADVSRSSACQGVMEN